MPMFLELLTTSAYVNNMTKTSHYPGMRNHDRFVFDFFLAEMERYVKLEVSTFVSRCFSNTLPLLRKVLISFHLQLKKNR